MLSQVCEACEACEVTFDDGTVSGSLAPREVQKSGLDKASFEEARYGDDAPSSMPAKLMEEDTGVRLQAPGFDGFTYQDRTSNWDRPLKGGRWTARSKL